MKTWMFNGSLDDWAATREGCGFASAQELEPVSDGDKIIYFCNGLILGIFEAEKIAGAGFAALKGKPYQVKLQKILIPQKGLVASPLHYKISLQKHAKGSPTLWEISEWECNKIMQALREGNRELMF